MKNHETVLIFPTKGSSRNTLNNQECLTVIYNLDIKSFVKTSMLWLSICLFHVIIKMPVCVSFDRYHVRFLSNKLIINSRIKNISTSPVSLKTKTSSVILETKKEKMPNRIRRNGHWQTKFCKCSCAAVFYPMVEN